MANSTSHACLPYPIRNARFTLPLSFRVSAGTLTDPTTPDTEFSVDGGASYSDTAEEITTGGSNGVGYLTLTGAETNNNVVALAGKSANCLTTPAILYPRVLAVVGSGTLSAGSAGGGTLGTLLAYDVTGCFIRTTGGTGGGGTGGANNQARKIVTYTPSTGAFTVSPNWETTPDGTTTYDVLLPEGMTLGSLRAMNPATPGRTPVVDANGLMDATAVKVGPTGAATAQTARDLGASVLLSSGTGTGQVSLSSGTVTVGTNNDKTGYGLSSAAVQAVWDALTSALTTSGSIGKWIVDKLNVVLSTVLGSPAGASISADIAAVKADTDTLLTRLTSARAGYLDNLNVGGAVASNADVLALNQSASRRLIITSVPQYERPESGSSTYTIEVRTYDGDGAATNADSDPTLTGTGTVTGSLAANISAITNPSTGVYRWTYTVASGHNVEQTRFDASATIGGSTFTLSQYSQVTDLVSATFTATDQTHLTAIFDRLPSKAYLTGSTNSDGDVQLDEATGGLSSTAQGTVRTAVGMASANLDTQLLAIVTDTNELQTDWANGGRLDLLIDAIKAKTDLTPTPIRGTVAASPAPTSTSFKTDIVSSTYTNNCFNDQILRFLSGTLLGQTKPIVDSGLSGGFVDLTFDEGFTTAPTAGDSFEIIPEHIHPITQYQAAVETIVIETGINLKQQLQLIGAGTAGKSSGGPGSPVMKGTDGTTDRITGVADASGNRTTATYNV